MITLAIVIALVAYVIWGLHKVTALPEEEENPWNPNE